jgi:hypothetical protein
MMAMSADAASHHLYPALYPVFSPGLNVASESLDNPLLLRRESTIMYHKGQESDDSRCIGYLLDAGSEMIFYR